ncbi:flavonoid 3'-monooxygenase-like [Selaginella moellendorffii]|uniref:flavonoid 3'-monooxygenase-like n=1 Tax=Selaginella moellendorffii TaxID=88036 RepID=UPI000D1C98FE|nr:flavonoid 3'-monooxygenase-like [Selaginella moellendorffii]|eukprot:XP_024535166.1 flavonoid 3'-monooxygenase-like [Selaginella moellendorffii]
MSKISQRISMDSLLYSSVWYYWTTCLCLAIAFFALFNLYSRKKAHSNLPPGPFSWPLVGSLPSLGRSRHRSLHRLAKKYGPIMYMELGSRPHVIISSPAMAREVLKDHDVEFASRPQFHTFFKNVSHDYNDLVFAPHGERWKMLRRVSGTEIFAAGRVNHFSGIRKRELAAFASIIEKSAAAGEAFDLTALLHELFTNLMTSVLFGQKFYNSDTPVTLEAEAYRAVWDTIIAESERLYIGDFIPALRWVDKVKRSEHRLKNQIIPAVENFLNAIVKQHKESFVAENPPRDFVDVMLSLGGENKMDDMAIIALLQNLLVAGTNTSKGTVEWAMSEMIRCPGVQKKAHEELDRIVGRNRCLEETDLKDLPYIQAIVKEVLRLHPLATTGLPHSNPATSQLAGYTIPANTTLLVNIWGIHHDPANWSDPESFCPERFLGSDHSVLGNHFDLIPFGSGRRRCVGMPLAIPHVSLTLAYLLHRFEWRMPDGQEIDMEETTGLATMPAKRRIVCATVRK